MALMNGHFLILGGARSGKTSFAERLALQLSTHPAYLATAEALDDEMRLRVSAHQSQREGRFTTFEEPVMLADTLEGAAGRHDVVLVDCLTLWMSNLLGAEINVTEALDDLVDALEGMADTRVILVSNEVGQGIVPDNALARAFRDLAGAAHQRLAGLCGNVYFVTAGLPMALKGQLPDLD